MVSYMKYHHGCEGWKTKNPQWWVFILSYLITNWGKYLSQPFGYRGLGNQSMAKIGKTYANKIWKHLTMFHHDLNIETDCIKKAGCSLLLLLLLVPWVQCFMAGWPRDNLFLSRWICCLRGCTWSLRRFDSIIKPVVSLANPTSCCMRHFASFCLPWIVVMHSGSNCCLRRRRPRISTRKCQTQRNHRDFRAGGCKEGRLLNASCCRNLLHWARVCTLLICIDMLIANISSTM